MKTRSISAAALILVVGFIGSRLLGLARNVVIGDVFGTSPELDAYFAAFRLPDIIFQLLAGAALGSAFIPTFARYLARGRDAESDAWRLASSVMNIIILVTLVFALLGVALAPWIVPLTVPGFTDEQTKLAVDLTRIMLISPVFFCASGIASGILNARFHFVLPAVAPMVYNLSIIVAAEATGRAWGVRSLAVGVVIGAVLHLLIQVPGLLGTGMRYATVADLRDRGVREVGRLMAPRVLGLATVQVNFLVITILASTLEEGSLASLNYAWNLVMLPLGVFGIALGTAVFPTLAQQAAVERIEALRATLSRTLRLVLFLTIPASVVLIILRDPIVVLLFQRGLFDAESTRITSFALLFYAVGLFPHAMLEVLTRGFYALSDTRTPVALALLAMAINLALAWALLGPLEQGGLALALSLSTLVEALLLFELLRRRLGSIGERGVGVSVSQTAAASVALSLVLAVCWLLWETGTENALHALAVIALAAAAGAPVYLLTARWLGSEEAGTVFGRLGAWRLLGRRVPARGE